MFINSFLAPFFGVVPVMNLEIQKSYNFPQMIKKKKSEQFPVVCPAQLLSGLWFGSVCLCSGCVSACQAPYHDTQSVGVCVLQWCPTAGLWALDDSEEK